MVRTNFHFLGMNFKRKKSTKCVPVKILTLDAQLEFNLEVSRFLSFAETQKYGPHSILCIIFHSV